MMALWMVHDKRLIPSSLTLVSSTYSVNPATTGVVASLNPEDFRAGSSWLEATAKLHDPHQGDGYFDATLLPGFRKLTRTTAIDLDRTALAAMTMPTCVIHGEEDEILPVELARQLAAGLPNRELHLIPGQSHALIFRQPWKVSAILQAFLAKHPVAAYSS
jgi:pimeloyl-ACP methyl ester carboxylesterase